MADLYGMQNVPRIASLVSSFLGWLVIAPVAAAIPKRKDWIAVIGRQNGEFLDNAKHFFIQAQQCAKDFRLVFIAKDEATAMLVRRAGRESWQHRSLASSWFLARCGTVVVDSTDWGCHFRRFLLVRTMKIQLWHGIPIKLIEQDRWKAETGSLAWTSKPLIRFARTAFYRFQGRWVTYDVITAPSRFVLEHSLRSALSARKCLIAGHPRNGFSASRFINEPLCLSNVDQAVVRQLPQWSESGQKLILIAPTFRESGKAAFSAGPEEVQAIERFCEENACELLFKLHPSDRSLTRFPGRHIHFLDPKADIYPILPYTHALVTDYSSICFDYLLVDKPIVFYRRGDYESEERGTYPKLLSLIQSPSASSWPDVLKILSNELIHDSHRGQRIRALRTSFDGHDQGEATKNILCFLRDSLRPQK